MRNKTTLFITLFLNVFLFSQKNEITNNIALLEGKAAASKIVFLRNPNTQNYDITYHKLEFTIDPAIRFINGKVTTTFTALSNMNTVIFDLSKALLVSEVLQDGSSLLFTQNNTELIITLPVTQAAGATTTLQISYSGIPNSTGSFVTTQHASVPVLWTLSEPFGAMEWWPCKQDLNDKVESIDVVITAPAQYTAVSNGVESQTAVLNGADKTTYFHHNFPIPAYLIAIAVTNYSVYNQTSGTGTDQFPIINYIYPENLEAFKPQLDQTPLILELFKNLTEIYPFHTEKYGHAQFGWGGGMEHTTVSFMVNFSRGLIAHEMAHQWFGDKITCGSWKDIWLNEGFATYFAALVIENFDGQAAFISNKNNMINSITSQTGGAVYLTDQEITDVSRIFSSRLTYNKGAMVLNMLRLKLGDAAFFQGIKNYLADPNLAYKYANTSHFQSHMELVYGNSLADFFNDWIYKMGYPSYSISANKTDSDHVKFILFQTQSDPSVSYFKLPVPIRVIGSEGQQTNLILNNTYNGQEFIENISYPITSIVIDPDKNIISKNNSITLVNKKEDLATPSLYPNPAQNTLTLTLGKEQTITKAVFYSILGQKVKETTVAKTWDISGLSAGVYFVHLFIDGDLVPLQFIKE
jgi:aminopeptidase N